MNEGREFVDIVYGDDGFGAHGFDGGEAGPACDVDWEGVDDRRSEPDGDFESEVVVVASRCGDVKGERVGGWVGRDEFGKSGSRGGQIVGVDEVDVLGMAGTWYASKECGSSE